MHIDTYTHRERHIHTGTRACMYTHKVDHFWIFICWERFYVITKVLIQLALIKWEIILNEPFDTLRGPKNIFSIDTIVCLYLHLFFVNPALSLPDCLHLQRACLSLRLRVVASLWSFVGFCSVVLISQFLVLNHKAYITIPSDSSF